jgi:thiol-disulfide isomerase/thioredoxin
MFRRFMDRLSPLAAALVASLALSVTAVAPAQDAPKKGAEQAAKQANKKAQAEKDAAIEAEKKAEKKAAEEAAAKAAAERYTVPADADVAGLIEFIETVKGFEPTSTKEEVAHRQKAMPAIIAAAKKIVEKEEDESSTAYTSAQGYLLLGRLSEARESTSQERKQLIADAKAHLFSHKPGIEDLQIAMSIARSMEVVEPELAGEAYTSLGDAIAANAEDDQAKSVAATMQGAGRRLNLVGNPIEITGSTHGGMAFDIASLKGKVVLVDFWATWCGPCIAEVPNMKKNYEAYKDRGFEIVGISLDQNREALDEYLKEKDVPWITLHEKDKDGQHPAAMHYGIFGIPAMFLVDQEGKVVSTEARGEKLDELLAELLGPIEEKTE